MSANLAVQSVERLTHEQFIHAVIELGLERLDAEEQARCKARVTYGAGQPGLRGVTYYGRWLTQDGEQIPFVEICSFGQESPVQLAGTTLHEMGHVLAGFGAGHSRCWKAACEKLGLSGIQAAGTNYALEMFSDDIRHAVEALIARLELAKPSNGLQGFPHAKPKVCPMGVGTRGGKSRGTGSGSRLRKFVCECEPPMIIRASRDEAHCTCSICKSEYQQAEAKGD